MGISAIALVALGAKAVAVKAAALKVGLVTVARPVVSVSWPAVEVGARAYGQLKRPRGVSLEISDSWDAAHDEALERLPAPDGCSRDAYRILTGDTDVRKKHIVVYDGDEPLAVLSLRRRKAFWEPVTIQCLPGFIAPARDEASLRRAIAATGLEIVVPSGLKASAKPLRPQVDYGYDIHQIDLSSDYEAFWELNGRRCLNSIKKARRKCKDFQVVVDGAEDIAWGVGAWRDMWADDPDNEVCAYHDRLRFWEGLRDNPDRTGDGFKVHTLSVRDGENIAAAVIFLSRGDRLYWQCTSRNFDYNKFGVGTYALDQAVAWAKAQGFALVDLAGGGGFKADWAPVGEQRYGAEFRPGPIAFLRRIRP